MAPAEDFMLQIGCRFEETVVRGDKLAKFGVISLKAGHLNSRVNIYALAKADGSKKKKNAIQDAGSRLICFLNCGL